MRKVHWHNALAMRFAPCTLLFVIVTSGFAQQLSPTAGEFVNQGAQTVLSKCDLPKRKCDADRFKLRSADLGEVNGDKRSFETFVTNDMEVLVIFVASNRSKYYLSSVEISSAQWPSVNEVKVGLDRESVIKALGEPNGGTKNSCDSYFDEEHRTEAVVCYNDGKVKRIRWEHSVD